MKHILSNGRLLTLLKGLTFGVLYSFFAYWIIDQSHKNVSISFIFILPIVLGAIPVIFSTKEQLNSYLYYLLMPWGIVLTFFYLSYLNGMEGLICLIVIVGPFLLLGSLGAFIFRLISIKRKGKNTPLYSSLLLPFIFLIVENSFVVEDHFYEVVTEMEIDADQLSVWDELKEVKDIQKEEIPSKFIYSVMQIPKPLNGELDTLGVGATRSITWEKEIAFEEKITEWDNGKGFSYEVVVNPGSIPPTSLDEHVLIGGRYFDVISGGYQLIPIDDHKTLVKVSCKYRITTTFNSYSKWWADFVVGQLNETILTIIKNRAEK